MTIPINVYTNRSDNGGRRADKPINFSYPTHHRGNYQPSTHRGLLAQKTPRVLRKLPQKLMDAFHLLVSMPDDFMSGGRNDAKYKPPEVLARFNEQEAGEVAMSVVTYGELYNGAIKSQHLKVSNTNFKPSSNSSKARPCKSS